MIKALLLFLVTSSLWARPVVLISYFDAFGKASFNNSEKIAEVLHTKLKDHPSFELRLCALNTVFDKSTYQLEDCLRSLPTTPKLVLGLGEANCNFKIETMGRNLDKTSGPDNEGNERNKTEIIPFGPKAIGLNYPLSQMYCALPTDDRKEVEVSNNAGSFVCNNLAYQMAHQYPELTFGFIHVPSHNCRGLEKKNVMVLRSLGKMILAAVETNSFTRLSTTKNEIEVLRNKYKDHQCLSEFFKRTKGIDEKSRWPF